MNRQELREECKQLNIPFTLKNTNNELSNKIRLKKMSNLTKEGVITCLLYTSRCV